jgi:hypothetical protein
MNLNIVIITFIRFTSWSIFTSSYNEFVFDIILVTFILNDNNRAPSFGLDVQLLRDIFKILQVLQNAM